MSDFDVVIAGGGHNGLVAAILLAKAGKRVAVYEQHRLGGIARRSDHSAGQLAHDTSTFSETLARSLDLDLSWQPVPPLWIAGDGEGRVVPTDLGEDKAGVERLNALVNRLRPFASRLLTEAPPKVGAEPEIWSLVKSAFRFRSLGNQDMLELIKIAPMSAEDFLGEFVSDPQLRAGLAMTGLRGTWMGPYSPQSAATWLFRRWQDHEREVSGGPAALIDALVQQAETLSVVLHEGARVERISLRETREGGDRIHGVFVGGEEVICDAVVVACDSKPAVLDWLPPYTLPHGMVREAQTLRQRGAFARVDFTLGAEPAWVREGSWARIRVVRDPVQLERGFDCVKHGRFPDDPPLDVRVWRDGDRIQLACALDCVSAALDWSDDGLAHRLKDAVLGQLDAIAPGIGDLVDGHSVATPSDLRRLIGSPHLYHGEHALDQLFVGRPGLQLSRGDTPIQGLVFGGSGVHPGGGLTGVPGRLAAEGILAG